MNSLAKYSNVMALAGNSSAHPSGPNLLGIMVGRPIAQHAHALKTAHASGKVDRSVFLYLYMFYNWGKSSGNHRSSTDLVRLCMLPARTRCPSQLWILDIH